MGCGRQTGAAYRTYLLQLIHHHTVINNDPV
jgi:hypothetical protein